MNDRFENYMFYIVVTFACAVLYCTAIADGNSIGYVVTSIVWCTITVINGIEYLARKYEDWD